MSARVSVRESCLLHFLTTAAVQLRDLVLGKIFAVRYYKPSRRCFHQYLKAICLHSSDATMPLDTVDGVCSLFCILKLQYLWTLSLNYHPALQFPWSLWSNFQRTVLDCRMVLITLISSPCKYAICLTLAFRAVFVMMKSSLLTLSAITVSNNVNHSFMYISQNNMQETHSYVTVLCWVMLLS